MKKLIVLLFVLLCCEARAQTPELVIKLTNNDAREQQTKAQLVRLTVAYDLKRWIFTTDIAIESGFQVAPHSHPVLTLSTRHVKDDELLLSTFVHEQLHWFIEGHPNKQLILEELKSRYPAPEINFPEGSGGMVDTYYHILICHLEYQALKQLLGELRAYQIISFWQQDHYRWIYTTVLKDQQALQQLVRKQGISL